MPYSPKSTGSIDRYARDRSRPRILATSEIVGSIRIEAMCTRLDGNPPKPMVVEESMPIAPILQARTVAEATNYFLGRSDVVSGIDKVTSLKIDGHELLGTFME
jgi:hypothetical protein